MRKWRQKIAVMLMLAVLATFAPVENVEAKAKSPAKLGTKDFVYTNYKGKKEDFLKISKKDEGYYSYYYELIDNKNMKGTGNAKVFKTYRNVKLGSKETYVKKRYGKTSKRKTNKKEKFYKLLKYDQCGTDISGWKSYLEYSYTKGKDKYKIRFYLNKKNKVTAIVYIKNLNEFYNYPNKEAKPNLTFQAPKGKKVTTKTINGKKVYMIPKGTTVKLKNSDLIMYIEMFDIYGKSIGFVSYDDFKYNEKGVSCDLEKMTNEFLRNSKWEIIKKKPAKYSYYTLHCDDFDDMRSLAPAVYYFKFK